LTLIAGLLVGISPSAQAEEPQAIKCSVFGTFTVFNNVITKNTDCAGEIVIPDYVIEIARGAFSDNKNITSIVFGKGKLSIKQYAFYQAGGIRSLTLPESVTQIGWGAFNDLKSLESLTLNARIAEIEENNFNDLAKLKFLKLSEGISVIPGHSFRGNNLESSLESLTLPESVRKIGPLSFSYLTRLEKLELNNGLVEIGSGAFQGLGSLLQIRIPQSVQIIGDEAFRRAYMLKSFDVEEGNKNYSSDSQGGLYDYAKTKLIYAPLGRTSFIIPPSVKFISKNAFGELDVFGSLNYAAKSLATLIIPLTVSVVDEELIKMINKAALEKVAIEKAEAEAKAAAEFRAKQEAEAKAAAELKAKQEAGAKAAAEIVDRARVAKAIADLNVKFKSLQKSYTATQLVKIRAGLDWANITWSTGLQGFQYRGFEQSVISLAVEWDDFIVKNPLKTTITCVKGKLVKKVTAVKPVCPAGYKKK
jgi:hypothetical protein